MHGTCASLASVVCVLFMDICGPFHCGHLDFMAFEFTSLAFICLCVSVSVHMCETDGYCDAVSRPEPFGHAISLCYVLCVRHSRWIYSDCMTFIWSLRSVIKIKLQSLVIIDALLYVNRAWLMFAGWMEQNVETRSRLGWSGRALKKF